MSGERAVRIVVGEGQPLTREGIVAVLEEAGFEVVAVAGDAPDLLRKAAAHKPDVVITDIRMPPNQTDDGLRAAQQIRAEQPGVGVLVLSEYLEDRYAIDLVGDRAEGVGYLLKDRVGDLALFVDAVRRVAHGGSALAPTIVQRMVGRRARDEPNQQAYAARARGPLDDGRGTLKPWDRRDPRCHTGRGRAPRDEHFRQARPPSRTRRPSPSPCCLGVPEVALRRECPGVGG